MRNGQTWGKRLSVLEGFGAAQCVTLWAKEIVRIGAAVIYVDNAGFVFAYGNSTSRCEYVYSMAKFIVSSLRVGPGSVAFGKPSCVLLTAFPTISKPSPGSLSNLT